MLDWDVLEVGEAIKAASISYRQPCEIAPAFVDAISPPEDRAAYKQKLAEIQRNIQLQQQEARDYVYCRKGQQPDCSKTLHVSLFFDGTNNHRIPDANSYTLSNVARLYRATIGPDPESETATSSAVQEPTENMQKVNKEGFYAYYASGVGTVFEPVDDNTPNSMGLIAAAMGEPRINWMLTRVVYTLYSALGVNRELLNVDKTKAIVKGMQASLLGMDDMLGLSKAPQRKEQIEALLNTPEFQEKLAIQQEAKGSADAPKILSMRLYVYGFSRGAAEARAFCNWLQELLTEGTDAFGNSCLTLAGIPIIVEFLGVFDTVPAVGLANSFPMATGHMGWADFAYMRIPDDTRYLKKCLHLVAAHEQRASFAVDSIRQRKRDASGNDTGESSYRVGTKEYVYPGVHSDVGGGYAPNDQGKGLPDSIASYAEVKATVAGKESEYLGYNLSQLMLHHMYREAFAVGAPLKIWPELMDELPKENQQDWRLLMDKSTDEFAVDEELLTHFNGWRRYASAYTNQPIEDILKRETALITAWRISRYDPKKIESFNFFKRLPPDITDEQRAAAERASARVKKLQNEQRMENEKSNGGKQLTYADVLTEKEEKQRIEDEKILQGTDPQVIEGSMTPYKMYEPMLDRRQLYRGALDFHSDYNGVWDEREDPLWSPFYYALQAFSGLMYLLNEEDEAQEYVNILRDGKELHKEIFIEGTDTPKPQYADMIKLFDNQIHDSRAWFMNSTSGYNNREPATSYFSYRRIQLGTDSSKAMTPVVIGSKIIGLAVVTASITLSIKRKNPKYLALLLAPTLFNPLFRGRLSLPYPDFLERSSGPVLSYIDEASGLVLPMLDGAKEAMTYTTSMSSAMAKIATLPEPVTLTAENASFIPNGEIMLQASEQAKANKAAEIASAFAGLFSTDDTPAVDKKSSLFDVVADTLGVLDDSTAVVTTDAEPKLSKVELLKQMLQLDSSSTPSYEKTKIVTRVLETQPPEVVELLQQIPRDEWMTQLRSLGVV